MCFYQGVKLDFSPQGWGKMESFIEIINNPEQSLWNKRGIISINAINIGVLVWKGGKYL